MAPASTVSAGIKSTESPYRLDRVQTVKASTALLKHMKSEARLKETSSNVKNLLTSEVESSDDAEANQDEPIWLVVTTKKHIVDQKRLKPGKIFLPHSLNKSPSTTVCLITADPQRAFKDTVAHPSFPTSLSSQINRVIGVEKLARRYKSFESRRQLLGEHDVFLADDRIVTRLGAILGKVFYKGSKRPIPVNLQPSRTKDNSGKRVSSKSSSQTAVTTPLLAAKEVERTLSCAQVHLSPSVTTSVRVGLLGFTAEQVADNIEAVIQGMEEKFINKGWRNIRALHIKGPSTMALPIWLASELWVEQDDILEDVEAIEAKKLASQKGKKRKVREGDEERLSKKQVKNIEDSDLGKEMAERRAKLRQQKKEAREGHEAIPVMCREETETVIKADKGKVKRKKSTTEIVHIS